MSRRAAAIVLSGTLLALAGASAYAANSVRCEDLLKLALPDTTISIAQSLPAGANPNPVGTIPTAICRVAGNVAPKIQFEVWLPTEGWNGKFQGVGNGGLAGSIGYGAMRTALATNYATASTDTGHVSADSLWFRNNQQVIDNGYRGIHEMTVKAKAIIDAFYGTKPKYSYFNGCSTGGGQGFTEVQRYPQDYDGVLAGAPNYRPTRLRSGAHVWSWVAARPQPLGTAASNVLANQYTLMGNAVLAACDTLDGVKDNNIEDPRRCTFDPAVTLCQAGQTTGCLTQPQVDAWRKLYAGAKDPVTAEEIFPGYARGAEFSWNGLFGGANPFGAANDFLRNTLFFGIPGYDFRSFDFHVDVMRFDQQYAEIINAESVDLSAFEKRGGKMLVYHGWADHLIPTYNTLEYWDRLVEYYGGRRNPHAGYEQVDKFARLFLIPGMGHCNGGANAPTENFDGMGALEQWVEQGKKPKRIVASHLTNGVVDKTRPLCLYPRVATYKGDGDTNDAANFVCRQPESLHDDDDED
jgi:feruloyl esterase